MTRNLTLAVDEDLLRKVRLVANQRQTSLNALVREHLEALARDDEKREADRRAALARLKEMSANAGVTLGADYEFSREDAYAERLR